MKKTQQQLIEELILAKQEVQDWQKANKNRLEEFAKAFEWTKSTKLYDYNGAGFIEPTWTEVFVELGKLLERQKRLDYITGFEDLKLQVRELSLEIQNLKLYKNAYCLKPNGDCTFPDNNHDKHVKG